MASWQTRLLSAPFNDCAIEVGDAESAPIILPVAELSDPMADPVIRVDNYSSYSRFFVVTSRVFEAISKMKKRERYSFRDKAKNFRIFD